MTKERTAITRRTFMKGVGSAALGVAGLPATTAVTTVQDKASRVVLIRDEGVVSDNGNINGRLVQQMLDNAMTSLFDSSDPMSCWSQIIQPSDIVGIKSNSWRFLPTPPEVEQAIERGLRQAGVRQDNIDIGDQRVLRSDVFLNATALVNTRPMRTHAWSGVGSLIKNYIMFVPHPPDYHPDACADLAKLWNLPLTKGKTRLNVLVMLTPQFHNIGPHHFDRSYVWNYNGLIVSTDPVAADTIGLHIIQRKRQLAFGEDRPLQPTAHHIALADTQHHLGNADMSNIELVRLGWDTDSLI
jgi:hypothetical protein